MNKNRIPVNNNRYIRVEAGADCVRIYKEGESGSPAQLENITTISGCDFVALLNWYTYQKQNGNVNLIF
jgi:hypothetical protein